MAKALLNRTLATCMAVWALWMAISPGRTWASPSESLPTVLASNPEAQREAQIEKIMGVLSRPEAQVQLRAAGIWPDHLREKLSKLDDTQLAMVADKADTVQAGGVLGLIIALLVIAILIVILIYLLNKDVEIKDEDKD